MDTKLRNILILLSAILILFASCSNDVQSPEGNIFSTINADNFPWNMAPVLPEHKIDSDGVKLTAEEINNIIQRVMEIEDAFQGNEYLVAPIKDGMKVGGLDASGTITIGSSVDFASGNFYVKMNSNDLKLGDKTYSAKDLIYHGTKDEVDLVSGTLIASDGTAANEDFILALYKDFSIKSDWLEGSVFVGDPDIYKFGYTKKKGNDNVYYSAFSGEKEGDVFKCSNRISLNWTFEDSTRITLDVSLDSIEQYDISKFIINGVAYENEDLIFQGNNVLRNLAWY